MIMKITINIEFRYGVIVSVTSTDIGSWEDNSNAASYRIDVCTEFGNELCPVLDEICSRLQKHDIFIKLVPYSELKDSIMELNVRVGGIRVKTIKELANVGKSVYNYFKFKRDEFDNFYMHENLINLFAKHGIMLEINTIRDTDY